jgi:hypothetical protein
VLRGPNARFARANQMRSAILFWHRPLDGKAIIEGDKLLL